MAHPLVDPRRPKAVGPSAVLEIGLLGPLTVTRDGAALEVTGPKRRALLILLALHAGTPVGRERIIEALWPDRPTGRAESTLRVHISHLRDLVEPDRDSDPRVLLTHGSAYLLAGEAVERDIDHFRRLVDEAGSHLDTDPRAALVALDEALGSWRGRALQDVEYREFAQDDIRRLEQTRVEAIEDRAQALIELGRGVEAVDDLEALVPGRPPRRLPAGCPATPAEPRGSRSGGIATADGIGGAHPPARSDAPPRRGGVAGGDRSRSLGAGL